MRKLSVLLAVAGAVLLFGSFLPWPVGDDDRQEAVALSPAEKGSALFRAKGCVSCHRHAAVAEGGPSIGPDLTAYEADAVFLRRWLADPAAVRPGTLMPDLALEEEEIEALIAFLESPLPGPPPLGAGEGSSR